VSPFDHRCSPLCDDCVREQLAQLSGVAQCRGEAWARAIADAGIPIDRPWPQTEKMRAIARRKADDLTRDERLRELLVDELVLAAERWWNRALERAG
jgi:hypothetical protein